MKERDMNDTVYQTLVRLSDGRIGAAMARQQLRGQTLEGPAQLIKEGRWAAQGEYATGDAGARHAANDALAAAGEPTPEPA